LEAIADSEGDGERVCALDALLVSVTLAVFETRDDGLRLILVDELAVGDELEDDCWDPVCVRPEDADEDIDRFEETEKNVDGVCNTVNVTITLGVWVPEEDVDWARDVDGRDVNEK
jgi:hypothetical protein